MGMTPITHNTAKDLLESRIAYLETEIELKNKHIEETRKALTKLQDRRFENEQEIRMLQVTLNALNQLDGCES